MRILSCKFGQHTVMYVYCTIHTRLNNVSDCKIYQKNGAADLLCARSGSFWLRVCSFLLLLFSRSSDLNNFGGVRFVCE